MSFTINDLREACSKYFQLVILESLNPTATLDAHELRFSIRPQVSYPRTFQRQVDHVETVATTHIPVKRPGPEGVAVGDFDGDGHLDIVVANGVDDTVSVLLGTGSGNFQAQATFPVGSFAHGVALGDFDEDGHLDI
ncbi:hypothetical protein PENARI_c185G04639, partial [Penicillium arizonense]